MFLNIMMSFWMYIMTEPAVVFMTQLLFYELFFMLEITGCPASRVTNTDLINEISKWSCFFYLDHKTSEIFDLTYLTLRAAR